MFPNLILACRLFSDIGGVGSAATGDNRIDGAVHIEGARGVGIERIRGEPDSKELSRHAIHPLREKYVSAIVGTNFFRMISICAASCFTIRMRSQLTRTLGQSLAGNAAGQVVEVFRGKINANFRFPAI